MKNLLLSLGAGLGLALLGVAVLFWWMRSPNWSAADYDNLITYPDYAPGAADPDQLTVVSYNIGYLSGLTNQQAVAPEQALFDQNQATAIAALQQANPDIIGFQEIDFDAHRSFGRNQQYAIAAALRMPFAAIAINWDKHYVPFPYGLPSVNYQKVVSGQAILSRFPITRNQRIVLEKVPSNPFFYNALYLDRVAQVAELEVDGQPLTVINVHLEAFDAPTRHRQTEAVRQLAEDYASRSPVLLLGDFNSALNREQEGDDPSIRQLLDSPVLASAVPPAALTQALTFPADQPQSDLDYIFYTPKTLEVLDWQVVAAAQQASDHLPLMATVRWR